MNKILVGVIVGALLGAVDGLTAWFTPQVREQILSIVFFSTIKGVIAGVAAGWFARKVASVPKGIAFGFGVGLLLAFAVAAMPDPNTGEHYWWQIMVPGSLLGGVIGFATQRYGRLPVPRGAAAAFALILLAAGAHAHEGHGPAAANAAFDRLKSLAGTWNATMLTVDGEKTTVEYRVTAAGSAVIETMFPGTGHEMVNVYTVDGDAILATHYCSAGNQPVLRLDAAKSKDDELVFGFVRVTGKDTAYINGVTLKFETGGKVTEVWTSTGGEGPLTLYLHGRR